MNSRLRYDSNLWKVIYAAAGIPFKAWPNTGDWGTERLPKIKALRKLAYEQGFVEQDGYILTTLGRNVVLLLDQHL